MAEIVTQRIHIQGDKYNDKKIHYYRNSEKGVFSNANYYVSGQAPLILKSYIHIKIKSVF